jgi:hypothetical protein
MQEEITNTIEGLSEDDLQSITGGCRSCTTDLRIVEEADNTLQEYQHTINLHGPQALPSQHYQVVKSQGQQAVNRIIERHPHPLIANMMAVRYPRLHD